MLPFLKKKKTIREETVKAAADLVQEYARWYESHGLMLPPKYAHDPSTWTAILMAMAKSFKLLQDDMNKCGAYYDAKHKYEWSWKQGEAKIWEEESDSEEVRAIEEEINRGLAFFGENLLYLTDVPKDKE